MFFWWQRQNRTMGQKLLYLDCYPTNPTAGRETQGERTIESHHTSLICIKAKPQTLKQICKLRASVTNPRIDSWHCRHLQDTISHRMAVWVIEAWIKRLWKAHFLKLMVQCYSLDGNNNMSEKVLRLNKAKLDDVLMMSAISLGGGRGRDIRKEQERERYICRSIWFRNITNYDILYVTCNL